MLKGHSTYSFKKKRDDEMIKLMIMDGTEFTKCWLLIISKLIVVNILITCFHSKELLINIVFHYRHSHYR